MPCFTKTAVKRYNLLTAVQECGSDEMFEATRFEWDSIIGLGSGAGSGTWQGHGGGTGNNIIGALMVMD